jgi:hypothetical protein
MVFEFLRNLFRSLAGFLQAAFRDIRALILLIKIELKMYLNDRKNIVLVDIFRRHVRQKPDKPCIIFNQQTWTFQDVRFKKK